MRVNCFRERNVPFYSTRNFCWYYNTELGLFNTLNLFICISINYLYIVFFSINRRIHAHKQKVFYMKIISVEIFPDYERLSWRDFRRSSKLDTLELYIYLIGSVSIIYWCFSSHLARAPLATSLFDLFNISHKIRAVAPRNVSLLLHFRFYISKFRANTSQVS